MIMLQAKYITLETLRKYDFDRAEFDQYMAEFDKSTRDNVEMSVIEIVDMESGDVVDYAHPIVIVHNGKRFYDVYLSEMNSQWNLDGEWFDTINNDIEFSNYPTIHRRVNSKPSVEPSVEIKKEGITMGKFQGYRTVANVSPITDAPNYRIVCEDYTGMMDAILARTVDGEWQRVDLDSHTPQLPSVVGIDRVSAYDSNNALVDDFRSTSKDLYAAHNDKRVADIKATIAEFFGQHNADKAVIAWRALPSGDMAWIIDLPSGEQYRWDNGFIVRLPSRVKLTNNQVSELLLQIDSFVSVVNSAFDVGDWNRAEQASLYAMGISKLLG